MQQQIVVYAHNAILSGLEKEGRSDAFTTGTNLEDIMLRGISQSQNTNTV